jgi:hypothetical protein
MTTLYVDHPGWDWRVIATSNVWSSRRSQRFNCYVDVDWLQYTYCRSRASTASLIRPSTEAKSQPLYRCVDCDVCLASARDCIKLQMPTYAPTAERSVLMLHTIPMAVHRIGCSLLFGHKTLNAKSSRTSVDQLMRASLKIRQTV